MPVYYQWNTDRGTEIVGVVFCMTVTIKRSFILYVMTDTSILKECCACLLF